MLNASETIREVAIPEGINVGCTECGAQALTVTVHESDVLEIIAASCGEHQGDRR